MTDYLDDFAIKQQIKYLERKKQKYEKECLEYPLGTIGVVNTCKIANTNQIDEVQFYDIDREFTKSELFEILRIFPNDCVCYKTENGYHFVSFTLQKIDTAKAKALKLAKSLNEHYGCSPCRLVLRIAPKVDINDAELSPAPVFFKFFKKPKQFSRISLGHLEIWKKHMNLPDEVYNFYKESGKLGLSFLVKTYTMLVYYRCRNKKTEVSK